MARAESDPSAMVERLLDELHLLDERAVLVLADLWSDEDDQSRRRAWTRAREAVERAGLGQVLSRAREDVGRWMLAGPQDYQGISGLLGRDADHVAARRVAAPAVLDAVVALLAGERLHSLDRDVLLRPWETALAERGDLPPDRDA